MTHVRYAEIAIAKEFEVEPSVVTLDKQFQIIYVNGRIVGSYWITGVDIHFDFKHDRTLMRLGL